MARRTFELPLWTRWVLAVAFFASVGLVAFVVVRGGDSTAPTTDARGTLEANQVGQIVVSQDQAPHTAPLRAAPSPRSALARAIAADVRARIASRALTGPLGSVTCSADRARHAGRDPFVCTVDRGVADLHLLRRRRSARAHARLVQGGRRRRGGSDRAAEPALPVLTAP